VHRLTVTIITKDEAAHIADALASVAWADERVVVDAGSTDDTRTIAAPLADRVERRAWQGYGSQKNHAASLASHDWILSLDADERVTPALADQIRRVLAEPAAAAYRMPRVTWYLGRWIRSTDWYPDGAVRLYDRRRAQWDDRLVHEGLRVDGPVHDLEGELEHRPYADVSDHLARINHYTSLAADQMLRDGRRARPWHLLGHPAAAFLRNYLARGGIRQGAVGLLVSLLNATYVLLKFAKLYERQHAYPTRHTPVPDPRSPTDDPRP
jgi:glycosyltransferase involved in cell wall biosynthesis